jgi:hypothetical protein
MLTDHAAQAKRPAQGRAGRREGVSLDFQAVLIAILFVFASATGDLGSVTVSTPLAKEQPGMSVQGCLTLVYINQKLNLA